MSAVVEGESVRQRWRDGLWLGLACLLSACGGELKLGRNPDLGTADAGVACDGGVSCGGRCIGSGWEVSHRDASTALESLVAHVVDLDADGYSEAIFLDQYSETMTVYWGGTDFALANPTTVASGRVTPLLGYADFDGDGVMDLVISTQLAGPPLTDSLTFVFGARDRQLSRVVHRPQASNPRAVAGMDVTRDGKADVLVALPDMSCVALLVGHGDGTFDDATCIFAAPSSVDDSGSIIPLSVGTLLFRSLGANRRIELSSTGEVLSDVLFGNDVAGESAWPVAYDFDDDGNRDVMMTRIHWGYEFGVDAGPTELHTDLLFAEADGGFTSCALGLVPLAPEPPLFPWPPVPSGFGDVNGDQLPDGFAATTCGYCSSLHTWFRRTP